MSGSSALSDLINNISGWIRRLDDLSSKIPSGQIELAAKAERNNPKPEVEGLETRQDGQGEQKIEPVQPSTKNEGNNQKSEVEGPRALHDDQKRRLKRKAGEVEPQAQQDDQQQEPVGVEGLQASNDGEGLTKKEKKKRVVWYDDRVIDTIRALVRDIGTESNNLRKAKTSAQPKNTGGGLTGNENDGERVWSQFMLRRSTNEKTIYDLINNVLKTAQSRCETCADHFLRYVDCKKEIEGAKKKLEEVEAMAKEELVKQEEEEKKKEEQNAKRKDEGNESSGDEGNESPGDEGIEVDKDEENAEYSLSL